MGVLWQGESEETREKENMCFREAPLAKIAVFFIIALKAVDPRPPLCFENLGCKVCSTDFENSMEMSSEIKLDKKFRRFLETMTYKRL